MPPFSDCFFPQDSALPELYAAHPNATWVLPLRPVTNWIRSVDSWVRGFRKRGLRKRFEDCDLLDLPTGVGDSDDAMAAFYFSHNTRVRNFVIDHPSLTLVEFDIEAESPRPESVMQAAFGIDEHCWAQSNCHSSCDEREESSRLRVDDAAAGKDARAESRRLENLHAREVGSSSRHV